MFVVLLTNRVHAAKAQRPAKIIGDVRSDLSDAAVLAVMDGPTPVLAMPTAFRADAERGWTRPEPRPVRCTKAVRAKNARSRKRVKCSTVKSTKSVKAKSSKKAKSASVKAKSSKSKSTASKSKKSAKKHTTGSSRNAKAS
jgi:hypothetical protein